MKPLVVEVLRRRGPRPVEVPPAPLPPTVTAALAAIVREMRDVPRDCIRDPAELVFWLRRMAGRVEGVGRMRVTSVPAALSCPSGPPATAQPASSARDRAEAVFGKALNAGRAPSARTITSQHGRSVKVVTRRAKAAGQLEMQV